MDSALEPNEPDEAQSPKAESGLPLREGGRRSIPWAPIVAGLIVLGSGWWFLSSHANREVTSFDQKKPRRPILGLDDEATRRERMIEEELIPASEMAARRAAASASAAAAASASASAATSASGPALPASNAPR